MQCPFCGQTLESNAAWRSPSGRFYCTEFCAEAESIEPAAGGLVPSPLQAPPLQPEADLNALPQAAE